MTHEEYLKSVLRTSKETATHDEKVLGATLGLVGEAGETADQIKKVYFHGHDLDSNKLKLELGDVFFYLYRLCDLHGFKIEDVLSANVEKLKKRYPNGFSNEASKNRSE